MEFQEWFYQRFTDWRGRSRRSVSGFASHLGIRQPTVSRWLDDSNTTPDNYKIIVTLAHRYPEVYRVLELPLPYSDEVQQLAETWNELDEAEQQEILSLANVKPGKSGQPTGVFSDWIYQKFYEWRGQSRSNKYVSQFAEYLDLPNPTVTQWVNGTRANPTDYQVIVALARRYPEIYLELGLPQPYCDEVQQVAEAWPELAGEKRSQILAFGADAMR